MDVLIDHFSVSIDHSNKAFIGADVADHEWVFHFFDFGVFVANSLPEGLKFSTEQHMLDEKIDGYGRWCLIGKVGFDGLFDFGANSNNVRTVVIFIGVSGRMDGFGGVSSGTDSEEIVGLGINRGGEEGFIEFVIFVDDLEIEVDELGQLSLVGFMFLG